MKIPLAILVTITAAAIVATAPASSHPAKTPTQLRAALLTSTFKKLPAGFSSPKVSLEKPTHPGQVAGVLLEVSGPSAENAVRYSIYKTTRLALRSLRSPNLGKDFELVGRAPGWGKQSIMIVGSVTGKNLFGKKVTNGVTLLAVLRRNVIVQSISTSVSNEESGDVLAARRLLSYAVKQLDRLRAQR